VTQVGTTKIRADQIGASQAGAAQIRASKAGLDEVRPPMVGDRMPQRCAHEVADAPEQRADLEPIAGRVEARELISSGLSVAFGPIAGIVDVETKYAPRHQGLCLGQVPEQLVELTHDGEYVEHRRRSLRIASPVLPTEGHLGDLLTGAKAVEHDAALETSRSELLVDAATGVWQQIQAGSSGRLIDGEVGRRCKRRRNTAQPNAPTAIRLQMVQGSARPVASIRPHGPILPEDTIGPCGR
jgi:hypothetical protein